MNLVASMLSHSLVSDLIFGRGVPMMRMWWEYMFADATESRVLAKIVSAACCYPDPEVIKLFSYSTQLSTKLIMLINVKMPTIVGTLTFISMINTTHQSLKVSNAFICWYVSVYEWLKFRAQLIWAWKKFYNLGAWFWTMRRINTNYCTTFKGPFAMARLIIFIL